jgi:myxalamid-type polyketide synthase MxaE and MxaD
LPLYRDVLADTASAADVESDLRARLVTADAAQRRRLIDPVVREIVGRVLKVAPSRLDVRRTLGTMGLNSLMAMELRNRLETALGRALSATLAWNYPTVEALVAHLSDGDAPAASAEESGGAASGVAAHVRDLANISDEDALRALRSGRRSVLP